MKILIKGRKTASLERALKNIKEAWTFDELKWEYEEASDLPWEDYGGGMLGLAYYYLKNATQAIFSKFSYGLDAVIWYVPRDEWKRDGSLGYAPRSKYNSYAVAFIKERSQSDETLEHELWHLLKLFMKPPIFDWDLRAVHGLSPVYGIWRKDLGKFYYKTKDGDYSHTLGKLRELHGTDYHNAIEKRKILSQKAQILQLIRATLIEIITRLLDQRDGRDMGTPEVKSKIGFWANAIKEMEGWFEGSRSFRNNNPGNLKYAGQRNTIGLDNNGFAIFATYEDGWNALVHQLTIAADGRSAVYNPEMTLLEFFKVYAPASDNNHPENYAKFVADKIGVKVGTKIKDLL